MHAPVRVHVSQTRRQSASWPAQLVPKSKHIDIARSDRTPAETDGLSLPARLSNWDASHVDQSSTSSSAALSSACPCLLCGLMILGRIAQLVGAA